MAAPAPVLCAGGAGVLLGAFQVWGCQWLRGGAVGYAGGGAQRLGPTIAHRTHRNSPTRLTNQKSHVIWVPSLFLGPKKTLQFQRCDFKP